MIFLPKAELYSKIKEHEGPESRLLRIYGKATNTKYHSNYNCLNYTSVASIARGPPSKVQVSAPGETNNTVKHLQSVIIHL